MTVQRGAATKIGVISLGCAKNLVDTEVMLGHLAGAGCEFVQDPAEADVLLVNTCAFIGAAREESIQAILDAAEYKKSGKLRRLVVAGCMVQRYADELRRELPEVDGFISLDELHTVAAHAGLAPPPAALPSALPLLGRNGGSPPSRRARYLYEDATPRRLATPPWTAYVKIAEGCDHTCAFCAIPSFRGAFRSRTPDDIAAEAARLASAGVREINLIAQDSSHYGRDLGLAEGLVVLLERLATVPDLRWIRLHYLYPNTITEGLIACMARLERVVPYVDLPLQHAHPAVLRRMRRGSSAAGHLRLLDRFRQALPEVAIRSTMLVGFPGETEEEFRTLLEFVGAAGFDHLGVFAYSHEDGTAAATADDDVPHETKQERVQRVMERQQAIAFAKNRERVGRRVEVLVEGTHEETDLLLVGRMRTQAPEVDGQVLLNDGTAQPGEFVAVQLTRTAGYDLVGRICGPA